MMVVIVNIQIENFTLVIVTMIATIVGLIIIVGAGVAQAHGHSR